MTPEQIKYEQKQAQTKAAIFEYLDKLPEPYRSQAKENYDYGWALHFNNPRDIAQALNAAFPSALSKQGREYWDNVRLMAIRGQFNN